MTNHPPLDRKRILLTGCAGHVGKALFLGLTGAGATVVCTDHKLCGRFESGHHIVDLTNEREVREFARELSKAPLHGLVHSAALTGTGVASKQTERLRSGWAVEHVDQTTEAFLYSLKVQALSGFVLMQELVLVLKRSRASVVVLGSIYGMSAPNMALYEGSDYHSPLGYSATKGAMLALVRHWAVELAPQVRVNMVTPGGLLRGQSKEFVERYCKLTPMQRMGTEGDLVGPVKFLLSEDSGYVTGHNLVVDGGWTVW